ncbi:MAG: hypothetical protein WDN10_02140 [bacterium]
MSRRTLTFPLLLAALLVLALPSAVSAATFGAERSLVVSEAGEGNSYFASGTLTLAAPVMGDFSALGGSISVSAPIAGDALLAGGSVDIKKPVAGDVRILGGSVAISAPVGGDVAALAASFTETSGSLGSVFVAARTVKLLSGAGGPVTVYGSNVLLSGTFKGDVRAVVSDKLALAPGTHIEGTLRYEAPEAADVPASAIVDGGVTYTGASFLPTSKQAQALALAGTGVFLFVKILGALIAVGILAGLFPAFTEALASRVLRGTARRLALYALLGFALTVATPILVFLLALTFVGFAVALIAGSAYVLALSLAYCYAGAVAGALIRKQIFGDRYFSWRFAVLGMLVLSVVYLVPVIGPILLYGLWAVTLGALVSYAYEHAMGSDESASLFEST